MVSSPSLLVALCTALAAAASEPRPLMHRGLHAPMAGPPKVSLPTVLPVTDVNGTTIPPYDTFYYFDQLIDHKNPAKGTFKQRYYHTWEFYVPGGPIVIFPPGELNIQGYQGYLTNRTMSGRFAQENGGATIVIEHRFYGLSNPGPDLSDDSLQLLTIDQAIEDLVYFAKNVKLAMPGGEQVPPSKAPWVLVGGSYSGALTSWVLNTKTDFWAGYASSAVVAAVRSFWGYTEVIRQSAQKNCTADVQRVIEHVDRTLTFGTPAQIHDLKANWNLANITHLDDVAGALRYNLWRWQDIGPTTGRDAWFHQFCDALETKDGVPAGADGWGLDHALKAWGTFWNETYYDRLCGDTNAVDCLGSYDPTQEWWHNTELDQNYRSWSWQTCNELGYVFTGAPLGWPTLTSRLITPEYDERQCTYYFPKQFPRPHPANVARTNLLYKGFSSRANRLFFANGQRDPWREITMSTDFLPLVSTEQQPIAVSSGGYHCSDLIISYGNVDASIKQVQDLGAAYMAQWIAAWHAAHPEAPKGKNATIVDPRTLPRPAGRKMDIPTTIIDAPPLEQPELPSTPGSPTVDRKADKVVGNAMIQPTL